jgi:hypothetical protein
MNKLPVVLMLLLMAVSACRPGKVESTQELLAYANDPENGLLQEVQRGRISLRLAYHPKDIVVEQHLRDLQDFDGRRVDSIRQNLKEYDYFALQLSEDGHEILNSYVNTPQFNAAENYLSFDVGKDFRLIHGRDTIPTFDLIHTRTYGVSQHSIVLVAFKSQLEATADNTCVVQFNDTFFKTGLHDFEFSVSDIKHTPSLY